MRRRAILLCAAVISVGGASPALACGGLIGRNGAVNLSRTTTLAAYHGGLEHYVTAFTYVGGSGGAFGSIVPLPGMPSNVERGGDWTLQRLVRETSPPARGFALSAAASPGSAEVVFKTRIDALDITVLKGGGPAVGQWASEHEFLLPPDAPEVLDFYARRSRYFMAAVFDATAAAERGQQVGDGTPIHLTIPTANPWVPLRILGLGKQPAEIIEADVYLLTDSNPALLPANADGWSVERREPASTSLLDDLRSDKGMEWVPAAMWLTHMELSSSARDLRYDLAVDVSGKGLPSRLWAGLPESPKPTPQPTPPAPTPAPTVAGPPPQLIVPVALPPARPVSHSRTVVPLAVALVVGATAAVVWRAFRVPR